MEDEEYSRINTVLVIPANVAKKAIEESQKIAKKYETFFTLDGKNFFPHITLYSPEFPLKNFRQILKIIKQITISHKQFEIKFGGLRINQGFIGINVLRSPILDSLHKEIVLGLNSLREGHIRNDLLVRTQEDLQLEFSDEQKQCIKNYGVPGALELFHPHLTLTRLINNDEVEKAAGLIDWSVKQFTTRSIAACKMGKHGTCVELIEKFYFSQ